MSDRCFTTQADSGVSQDFDGLWHNIGIQIRLSSAGVLVGGRARYPSVNPSNFTWRVYRISDSAVMAEVDLRALFGTSPTLSAWNSFTSANFATPGDVNLAAYPGEEYAVAVGTNNDVVFKNTSVSYPISSGGIVSGVNSRFLNGGTGLQFPTGTNTTDYFFADVEINAAGGGHAKGAEFLAFFQ